MSRRRLLRSAFLPRWPSLRTARPPGQRLGGGAGPGLRHAPKALGAHAGASTEKGPLTQQPQPVDPRPPLLGPAAPQALAAGGRSAGGGAGLHPPPGTGMVGARQPLVLLARCPLSQRGPPSLGVVRSATRGRSWGGGGGRTGNAACGIPPRPCRVLCEGAGVGGRPQLCLLGGPTPPPTLSPREGAPQREARVNPGEAPGSHSASAWWRSHPGDLLASCPSLPLGPGLRPLLRERTPHPLSTRGLRSVHC